MTEVKLNDLARAIEALDHCLPGLRAAGVEPILHGEFGAEAREVLESLAAGVGSMPTKGSVVGLVEAGGVLDITFRFPLQPSAEGDSAAPPALPTEIRARALQTLLSLVAQEFGAGNPNHLSALLDLGLRDKVAIVTGGAGSLGSEFVNQFAAAGCRVVIADFESPRSQQLAATLQARYGLDPDGRQRVSFHPLDLGDVSSVDTLVHWTKAHYGRIDILVNNAANFQFKNARAMGSADFADLRRSMDAIIAGHLSLVTRTWNSAPESMNGAIINIGSIAGRFTEPNATPYIILKGAMHSLTLGLMADMAAGGGTGHTVTLGFGHCDSAVHRERAAKENKSFEDYTATSPHLQFTVPAGKFIRPDEAAAALLFAASKFGALMNGAFLDLTCGITSGGPHVHLYNTTPGQAEQESPPSRD